MKKSISLLLVICMFTGLFTGCFSKQISLEEDIINIQASGYLYTSQIKADTGAERYINKERERAVSSLTGNMEKAAKQAFNVIDGLAKYEDTLRKNLSKVTDPSSDELEIMRDILEKLLSYKLIIDTYEEEIKNYMEMKPYTSAADSIIMTYELDSIINLIKTADEYLAWLFDSTAITAAILGGENERKASSLISSSISIYKREIMQDLSDAYRYYGTAAYINSVIISADYYISHLYLNDAEEALAELKAAGETSSDSITALEEILGNTSSSLKKPDILIPLPEKEAAISFFRKVSAADENPLDYNTIVRFYKKSEASSKSIAEENIPEVKIPDADTIENKIVSASDRYQADPSRMAEVAKSQPAPVTGNTGNTGLFSVLSEGIKNASSAATRFVNTLIESAAEKAIDKYISSVQTSILKDYPDTASRYAAIIKELVKHLSKGAAIRDTDQIESVTNLIKSDLEELLGGNRETFVNFILNTKADKLLEIFQDWKSDLKDSDMHIYNRSDLISLINIMGIEASIPPGSVNKPSETTPIPENTASAQPSQTNQPEKTDTPLNPAETTDNYDITNIACSWQTLRELDATLSNASLLYTIYGWTDLLDYSAYEKTEILNKDGNLTKVYYTDERGYKTGWEIWIGDGYIQYEYRFLYKTSEDNDRGINIIRYGDMKNSYLYEVSTEDKNISRKTAVRFNSPDHPDTEENIKYIIQKENSQRIGLNTTTYNSNPTYAIFVNNEITESYTFKDGVMIREFHEGN